MARWSAISTLAAFAFGVAQGCSGALDAPTGDVCDQARALFARCGVTLPILAGATCTGVVHDAAQCVANHAHNCDDLGSIATKLDACASDALDSGDLVPPAENLPVAPPAEAAATDAATAADALATPRDATAADVLEASMDAGLPLEASD